MPTKTKTKKKTTKKRVKPPFIPRLYWHIHHRQLVEPTYDPIEGRRKNIRYSKPKSQQATRLKRMKVVKGSLPAAVAKALAALQDAHRKLEALWKPYHVAQRARGKLEAKAEKTFRVQQKKANAVYWAAERASRRRYNKKNVALAATIRAANKKKREVEMAFRAEVRAANKKADESLKKPIATKKAEFATARKMFPPSRVGIDRASTRKSNASLTLKNALQSSASAMKKLHKKECKGCPWDGNTLFPGDPNW